MLSGGILRLTLVASVVGMGSFPTPSRADGDGPCFPAQLTIPTGIGPRSVAIGDLDADGIPDLGVANEISNNASILPNQCDAPSCPADFNGGGNRNVLDFVAFQSAFVEGCPS